MPATLRIVFDDADTKWVWMNAKIANANSQARNSTAYDGAFSTVGVRRQCSPENQSVGSAISMKPSVSQSDLTVSPLRFAWKTSLYNLSKFVIPSKVRKNW